MQASCFGQCKDLAQADNIFSLSQCTNLGTVKCKMWSPVIDFHIGPVWQQRICSIYYNQIRKVLHNPDKSQ